MTEVVRQDGGRGAGWPLSPGTIGLAQFADHDHRLWLERRWGAAAEGRPGEGYALHIGMNPSRAGADTDDLTVRKDQEFTRRMGLSWMYKVNFGTLISTDPAGLSAPGVKIVHPANLDTILSLAAGALRIIVACGRPPDPLIGHARATLNALRGRPMECFGLTKDHWPKHSSRLAYDTPLVPFNW